MQQGGRHPRQRDERIIGVSAQLEPLAVHHRRAELRDERHVPPHAKRDDDVHRDAGGRPAHPLTQRCQPDDLEIDLAVRMSMSIPIFFDSMFMLMVPIAMAM